MPKNPKLNIARYKVGGGELNPFEFNQNQQAFVEQQQHDADNLIPGTPPESKTPPEGGALGELAADVVSKSQTESARKATPKAATKSRARSTKKAGTTKRAVSQKGREKSTKKSAKKTKPAKRAAASKRRPAKKAAKRSTKKAVKKTGTKKKARK